MLFALCSHSSACLGLAFDSLHILNSLLSFGDMVNNVRANAEKSLSEITQ